METARARVKHAVAWPKAHLAKPKVLAIVFGVYVLLIVPQFFYQSGKALPFASVDGKRVSQATNEYLSKYLLSNYGGKSLVIETPAGEVKSTLVKAGINTDTNRVKRDLTHYPLWQRFIPFSLVVKGLATDVSVYGAVDKARFTEFAKTVAEKCFMAPKNAGVKVSENSVVLDPAKPGRECKDKELIKQMQGQPITKTGLRVVAKTDSLLPDRTNEDVEAVIDEAQAIVAKRLAVSVEARQYVVPAKELASWLAFNENPKTKRLTIGLKQDMVERFLATAQKEYYLAPGNTVVTTIDGEETSRVTGTSGRGINMPATFTALQQQVAEKREGTVTAALSVLPPKLTYNRSYTSTQAGLQALLLDIAKDKGDFAISIRLSNGSLLHANGTKTYHPASTYKMFVGWAVLKQIEAGKMQWSDQTVNGQTVAQCFDAMIIRSDNPCGEWFGEKITWATVNTMLRGIGFTCTNLQSAWLSCANDQTLFLQKLQAEQLMNAGSTSRLLDVMKRQIYRAGIPKGVGGTVADKVGFINGYLHDSAIVYAPGGTYELSILSKGSSWGAIADAAAKIKAQLARMP